MKRRIFLGKFSACIGGLLGLVGIGKVAGGQKVSLALSQGESLTAIKLSDNSNEPFRTSIIWEEHLDKTGLIDATGVGQVWTTKQIEKHLLYDMWHSNGSSDIPLDIKWLRRIPEIRQFKSKGKFLVKHEWIELKHTDHQIFQEFKPKGTKHA